MGDEKSCEFCKNNNGIAILVTRHTLMGATKAEGAVSHATFKGTTAASGHSFMQKTLRSGYLYIYDENQKIWSAYYISKAGYCAQFDFSKPAPSAIKEKEPCVNIDTHKARALIIALKNPKKAGIVHFRFSDVEWSEAKKKEYTSLDYRKKHMQSIDIKEWIAGKNQGHVPITTGLTNNVIDFAGAIVKRTMHSKNVSGTLLSTSAAFVTTFINEAKLVAGKETNPRIQNGIILPIDDPVGLAMDVAAYLRNYNNVQRSLLTREETVGGVLQNLRPAIRQSVEEREVQLAKEWADDYRSNINPVTKESMGFTTKSMRERMAQTAEKVTSADLNRWGNEEWAKYEQYINKEKYQAAIKKLVAREQTKRQTPSSLESCFLSVVKSSYWINSFVANFDENSLKQAAAYTDTVAASIADTHENYFCNQYYTTQLSGSLNSNNILLNALALNQKTLKAKIATLDKTNWSNVSWDNLFTVFTTVMEQHSAENYRALSAIVGNLAGPLLELTLKASTQANKALVLLGVMSNQKFTYVPVTGSLKEVYRTLTTKVVQSINQNHGKVTNIAKIKAQIRLSEIQMEHVPGTKKVTVSVLLNNKALANATSYAEVASITKVGEIKVSSMSAAGMPGLVGIINSLLQYAVLTKSWGDLASQSAGLDDVFIERVTRLGSSIAGLSAAIGEGIQGSLKAWATAAGERIGSSAVRTGGSLSRFLASKFFGKVMVGTALLNGAWDVYNGYAKAFNGKALEGTALMVAGITGALAAIAFFFLWPVVGWILAAICVAATLIVALVMDNDLQTWINKSCLGTNKGEKPYPNVTEENKAFEKIFA